MGEILRDWTGYSLKQTRLDPRKEESAPDGFEAEVLARFREDPGMSEYSGMDLVGGTRVYRYMVPLTTNESCLPCHGEPEGEPDVAGYPKEGLEVGELAGAVSLVMPMETSVASLRANSLRHLGFFLVLAATLFASVSLLMHRLVATPLDRLKKAAAEMGEGKMDFDAEGFQAYGEIRELGEQFAGMSLRLKEMYENLEEMVAERTEELERVNSSLRSQGEYLNRVNRELETANKVKSHFLAAMSHELRTTLTSIIAFSELLLEDLPPDDRVRRDNLLEIKENGETLLNLIDNLLDLARLEAGRYRLDLELVDLRDVIGSVHKTMRPVADKERVELGVDVGDAPMVRADPEKVHRALLNLVGNAVKFTPAGGRVTVRSFLDRREGEAVIEVEDTGIGISPEEQRRILEPFYQVDGSDSRGYKGTGLGLALTRELVELHRGRIEVRSEPGRGSTFSIRLPQDPEEGGDGG